MKRYILNVFCFVVLAAGMSSCKDDLDYGLFNRDNRPAVPVTYPGSTTFGFNPYYTISAQSSDPIEIRYEIPANSGRTIKEITRIVTGTTALNVASVTTGATAANTLATGIPGQGTTATYTTSLAALRAKFPPPATGAPAAGTAAALLAGPSTAAVEFTEFAFMSLVTLDDNTTIIPVQLRLRITR